MIATGCRPQHYWQMPDCIKHLIRRRTGDDLRSVFASVREPFRDDIPWIESVTTAQLEPDDGQAVAVRVRLHSGETHYCFHSLEPGREYVVDGELRVAGQAAILILDDAGNPARAMLLNGTTLRRGELHLTGTGLRRSTIRSVDYARGIIELTDPVLGDDLRAGQTVLVGTAGGTESVTLRAVLSPTQFSIGDEDLRVGGGPVNEVLPEAGRLVTSAASPNAYAGLTVVNSRGQVQGRVARGDWLTLDRAGLPPLTADAFPPGEDGLGARFAVVIAGPGDEVILPSLALHPPQR